MRTQLHKSILALFALGAMCWAGFNSSALAGGLKVGDTLPDLTTFKLEGQLPDALKGKVVLLDFWASWCDPCKESFPIMDELQKQYGSKGLVIIAVNVDENRADMEGFLKKHTASFTVVHDAKQKLVAAAGISTMPSSFLVDPSGKVRFAHSGFRGEETTKEYRQEIESLLKK
ncbi:MAG TPA: TlpA disulfide reductase family protein [Verrucomicrobiae bacterium]|nr:TlpA disulfide reductase family protein [Verrucomicrobiae bacterium]